MNNGIFFNHYGTTDIIFPGAVSQHTSEKSMDMFKGKPAWGYIKSMVYKCKVNRRDKQHQIFNAVRCKDGLDVPHLVTCSVVK
jgi:hypothetical protein